MSNKKSKKQEAQSVMVDDEEELDEDEFVVERILDKRKRAGSVEYLLKWKDYAE